MSEAVDVLIVQPAASGGLAAHVREELEVLADSGIPARRAAVSIGSAPRPGSDARAIRALRREIAAASPQTIHAHGVRAGALSAIARGRRGPGRPRLVVTLHNAALGSLPVRVMGRVLLRITARGADHVLAVSPDLAEQARRAGARRVEHAVIPAPPRISAMQTDPGSSPHDGSDEAQEVPDVPEALQVLVIARLAPQKGLDDLLDAARLLARGPSRWRIRIAGEGPLRAHLAERIAAEHLEAPQDDGGHLDEGAAVQVELLGRREDVPRLLAESDLVVSAARWEGQPVALQEALGAGCAIVATDAGGTALVLAGAGRLVPPGDPAALAAAIAELADPARRAELRRRARTRARTLPGREDLATQLRAVLAPGHPR